jgi:hypothetical protein
MPILAGFVQRHVEQGEAAVRWRRYMGRLEREIAPYAEILHREMLARAIV